ncbi:MAG: MipA/OmpV family protein, partial [Beijerinckiaceae bacterium]|nr:MipA/OmpV family protein [Beijerinckiaceae bacterium]
GAVAAGPAFAQAAPGAPSPSELPADAATRDTLSIGAGVGVVPSYEGSDDYILVPAAVIRGRVSGFNFTTLGTRLTVDLLREQSASGLDLQFGPALNLTFNRTARITDLQVRALGRRDTAFEAGAHAGISKTGVITSAYDTLGVSVTYLQDVTGVHNSYTITPTLSYGTPLSRRAYVGLSGSATFAGGGYARTYFAVDPAGAARSGLPLFDNPRGGLKNFNLSALATYALSGDLLRGWQVAGTASYSRLQGDFARSPVTRIAGSADQFYGGIGIGYTF